MSMNDYLERIQRLRKKNQQIIHPNNINKKGGEEESRIQKIYSNVAEGRNIYRTIKRDKNDLEYLKMGHEILKMNPEEIENLSPKEYVTYRAIAKKLLNKNFGYRGAQIYEKIGKGYVAIPKLLNELEKIQKEGKELSPSDILIVESFIERNYQKPKKTGNLEKSVGVTGAILGFGGAILSLSLNVTGNAIGNIPTNSFNFIGVVFLEMGIASAALLMMRD